MTDAPVPIDDAEPEAAPVPRSIADVLVVVALVIAAAVVAYVTAIAISVLSTQDYGSTADEIRSIAGTVGPLQAGLLTGCALLLVGAALLDVETTWFERALGVVGALAVLVVMITVGSAIDHLAGGHDDFPVSNQTEIRIGAALARVSVAAIAACGAGLCWFVGTGRLRFPGDESAASAANESE